MPSIHEPHPVTINHPTTNHPPPGRPLRDCPECGSTKLEAVFDGETVNWFCHDCIRCWHVELGHVSRVAYETCPGCLYQERCRRAAT